MQLELTELSALIRGDANFARTPASATPEPSPGWPPGDLGQRIVVLDRGWVFVGQVTATPIGLRIEKAKCIRRWGTKQGLGELRKGPLEATVLDDAGTVEAPMRAVICTLTCSGF